MVPKDSGWRKLIRYSSGAHGGRAMTSSACCELPVFCGLSAFLVTTVLSGCTVGRSYEREGMCNALRVFADSIQDSAAHSVTLRTVWGVEGTKTCERVDEPPERALCAYLIDNTSWEFMAANVAAALRCVGVKFPGDSEQAYIEALAGSIRSSRPAFAQQGVEVRIDFATSAADGQVPWLTISVTRSAVGE
jgi:hypothetical protein